MQLRLKKRQFVALLTHSGVRCPQVGAMISNPSWYLLLSCVHRVHTASVVLSFLLVSELRYRLQDTAGYCCFRAIRFQCARGTQSSDVTVRQISEELLSFMQVKFDALKQQIQTTGSNNSSDQFYCVCGLAFSNNFSSNLNCSSLIPLECYS